MLESSHLDAAFAALAHPTRRAILARLAEGDATVNALAEPFAMSLPAISRHIRVLEQARLITRSRSAQYRPCSLNPATMAEVANWTDQYRHIWEARFDTMEAFLNREKDQPMSINQDSVRIERRFKAPIETVWAMWTEPAKFQKWYGPMGMSVPIAEIELNLGGTRKVCMEMVTPDRTMQMWFIGEFKEITAPTRLVYTESMCDADGKIIKPEDMGMPAGSPDKTEVIIELQSDGEQTLMTMTHKGVPAGSPGENGWNQAFDKLAEALQTA